jgi:hypothetical protein
MEALERFLRPLAEQVGIYPIGVEGVPCTSLDGQRLSDGYLSAISSSSEYRRLLDKFYQGVYR